MRAFLSILCFAMCSAFAAAQSFTIAVSPTSTFVVAGETANFSVLVTPSGGYSSSVFLSSTGDLAGTFSTAAINAPYPIAGFSVKPTPRDTGVKVITISGANKGLSSSASITLHVSKNRQWQVIVSPTRDLNSAIPLLDSGGNFSLLASNNSVMNEFTSYVDGTWHSIDLDMVVNNTHALSGGMTKAGVLWIGTTNGMYRYDGSSYDLFRADNSSLVGTDVYWSGIARDDQPSCVVMKDDGSFAVSHYNGTQWISAPSLPHSVSLMRDYSLYALDGSGATCGIIGQSEGCFYAGADSVSLSSISGQGSLSTAPDGSLYCTYKRFINSGGSGLVGHFVNNTWQTINVPLANSAEELRSVAVDSSGVVWVGSTKALHYYSLGTWYEFDAQNSALPEGSIQRITIDSKGNVWLLLLNPNNLVVFNPNGLVGIPLLESGVEQSSDTPHVLSVYPNPASDELTISLPQHSAHELVVRNVLGQIVYRAQTDVLSSISIPTSLLENGSYTCTAGSYTARFVVSR